MSKDLYYDREAADKDTKMVEQAKIAQAKRTSKKESLVTLFLLSTFSCSSVITGITPVFPSILFKVQLHRRFYDYPNLQTATKGI